MTLILGMSKAEGIYMSVDYRVTRNGKLVDDSSIKFVNILYPPIDGGFQALIGFTGAAQSEDGTPTGQWLRETLRGEVESPDDSMAHLRERLNRDFGRTRRPLIVNLLGIQGPKRYLGALTNLKSSTDVPQKKFEYLMWELEHPTWFSNGSGGLLVNEKGRLNRLQSQLTVIPRRAKDHMGLLASVNRDIAADDSTVSPFCHVSFVPSHEMADKEGFGPNSETFTQPGETAPFEVQVLFMGIDSKSVVDFLNEQMDRMEKGLPVMDDFDESKWDNTRRP